MPSTTTNRPPIHKLTRVDNRRGRRYGYQVEVSFSLDTDLTERLRSPVNHALYNRSEHDYERAVEVTWKRPNGGGVPRINILLGRPFDTDARRFVSTTFFKSYLKPSQIPAEEDGLAETLVNEKLGLNWHDRALAALALVGDARVESVLVEKRANDAVRLTDAYRKDTRERAEKLTCYKQRLAGLKAELEAEWAVQRDEILASGEILGPGEDWVNGADLVAVKLFGESKFPHTGTFRHVETPRTRAFEIIAEQNGEG